MLVIKRGMFFVYACIARMDFLDKIFIAIFFLPQIVWEPHPANLILANLGGMVTNFTG